MTSSYGFEETAFNYDLYILICLIAIFVLGVITLVVLIRKIGKQQKKAEKIMDMFDDNAVKTAAGVKAGDIAAEADNDIGSDSNDIFNEADSKIGFDSPDVVTVSGDADEPDYDVQEEIFSEEEQNVIIADISAVFSETANGSSSLNNSESFIEPVPLNDDSISDISLSSDTEIQREDKQDKPLFYKAMSDRVNIQTGAAASSMTVPGRMTYNTAKSGRMYNKEEIESIIKD
jgi:hypothetical protein